MTPKKKKKKLAINSFSKEKSHRKRWGGKGTLKGNRETLEKKICEGRAVGGTPSPRRFW